MSLNGWQRLYCFVFALLGCAMLALWLVDRPSDGFTTIYSCESPSFVTQAEAQGHLERNDYAERPNATQPDCLRFLQDIASGDSLRRAQAQWWSSLKTGAIGLAAFALIVYLIGYGVAWVWRGFRPKASGGTL